MWHEIWYEQALWLIGEIAEVYARYDWFISGGSVVLSVLLYFRNKRKDRRIELLRRKQLESLKVQKEIEEIRLEMLAKTIFENINLINRINQKVSWIARNTNTQRFLIFFAINGKQPFRRISCVWQHKQKGVYMPTQDYTSAYANKESSTEYRKMLETVEELGYQYFVVDQMQEGKLKKFYSSEGVQYSLVLSISRYKLDEENDAFVYVTADSFEAPFTQQDVSFVSRGAEQIRLEISALIGRRLAAGESIQKIYFGEDRIYNADSDGSLGDDPYRP